MSLSDRTVFCFLVLFELFHLVLLATVPVFMDFVYWTFVGSLIHLGFLPGLSATFSCFFMFSSLPSELLKLISIHIPPCLHLGPVCELTRDTGFI